MISLKSKDWEIDNIETILLDKDGTFIDLHFFWGKITEMRVIKIIENYKLTNDYLEKLCKILGYDINIKKMIPDGITAMYSRSKIIEIFRGKLLEMNIEILESELVEIFDSVSEDFYKSIENYVKPIEDAIEFIKKMYSLDIKLGIVTSDSVKATNLILKSFGWDKYFKVVIGRESSAYTKESGIPTKLALDKLNANPKTTLMIGDAPMDYVSAKNADIENIILVSTGQISLKELTQTTSYVVQSLKDLECLKI